MHFSTFLIAAIALYATSASGKCFQTGENWGDHGPAKRELAKACQELRGNYQPRQVAARCRFNSAGSVSYVFEIENYNSGNAEISQSECERNIGAQIDNCGHGGEVTNGGVRFRYLSYDTSPSALCEALLLTQIGATRIRGGARHSNRQLREVGRLDADGANESPLHGGGGKGMTCRGHGFRSTRGESVFEDIYVLACLLCCHRELYLSFHCPDRLSILCYHGQRHRRNTRLKLHYWISLREVANCHEDTCDSDQPSASSSTPLLSNEYELGREFSQPRSRA